MDTNNNQFRPLGRELKKLREKARESLANTSEAVEIDVSQLANFELGQDRPSQEILLLLISHFAVNEKASLHLWELAGYSLLKVVSTKNANDLLIEPASSIDEPKIMFTDTVDILVNNFGVVMSFKQTNGGKGQPLAVAKVGMSREHAKSVLQILQATLSQTEHPTFKLPGLNGTEADKTKPS